MEKNKRQTLKRIAVFGLMFIVAGMIALAGTILHKGEMEEMLRNTVMVMTGTGMVIFSFAMEEINQRFIYRNEGKYGRFSLMYLGGLLAAVFLPYLPVTGWPFLVIFVLLGVFSDTATGMMAGSVCLLLSVHYTGGDFGIFWLYFISGVAGCLVFSTLDDDFRVMLPLFISLAILTLCLTANEILFTPMKLSAAQFLIPAINLVVCCILLLISLKMFSTAVIHRNREKYMEINDPEFPLLVQLKEMSKEEYYHAVHTAYLSDRIARRLELDDAAAKACAYYHRIGRLKGENTWENVSAICNEYHFPSNTKKILKEYVDESEKVVSKETIIVLFADCIVSSILYLFEKDPMAQLDYAQLIDTVFQKKLETDELWWNEISLSQIREMKKIFIEEKLYYDFLR
ncbi:MAG: hypothetical protein HDR04_12630 [Lachnospiraceae bacterium]|nr:hypothetical protein [Lachnospiraceae bacterium]